MVQPATARPAAAPGQPAPVVIAQSKPPAAQLLSKDAATDQRCKKHPQRNNVDHGRESLSHRQSSSLQKSVGRLMRYYGVGQSLHRPTRW